MDSGPYPLRESFVFGATEAEVAAITGQSMQMVAHYGKQENQKKLAVAAVLKWEAVTDPT